MKDLKMIVGFFLCMVLGTSITQHKLLGQNQFNRAYRFPTPRPAVLPFEPKQKMVINSGDLNFTVGTYVPVNGQPTIFVMRADADGNVDWVVEYDFPDASEWANTIEVSHDGLGLVISGKVNSNNPLIPDFVIVLKISQANGTIVWANEYQDILELNTIVKRFTAGIDYYVLSGKVIDPVTSLIKPVAMSINDTDGSVRWSYQYQEGQAAYAANFHHKITGFAVQPGEVAFAGRYHNAALSERLISFFRVEPFTGNVIGNVLNAYDLEENPTDIAIGTSNGHVWDVARVRQGQAGNFDGYALFGTYITSTQGLPQTSEVSMLRLDQGANPLWANLYDHPDTDAGFGRGLYQNQSSFSELDAFTRHDLQNEVSGFLSVDLATGNLIDFREHDFDISNPGFRSTSMNRIPDNSGYLCLAQRVTGPNDQDMFQLISLDTHGKSDTDCEKVSELEVVALEKERTVIELIQKDLGTKASNCFVQRKRIHLSTRQCSVNSPLGGACWVCEYDDYIATECDDGKCYVFFSDTGGYGQEIDCDDINVRKALVEKEVGNNEISILVSPNPLSPAKSKWDIVFHKLENHPSEIYLRDATGKLLISKKLPAQTGTVQTDLFAPFISKGMYVFQVSQQGKIVYQMKLVKE